MRGLLLLLRASQACISCSSHSSSCARAMPAGVRWLSAQGLCAVPRGTRRTQAAHVTRPAHAPPGEGDGSPMSVCALPPAAAALAVVNARPLWR